MQVIRKCNTRQKPWRHNGQLTSNWILSFKKYHNGKKDAKKLIYVLLTGIPMKHLNLVQLLQTTASRVLTRKRKYDTPGLRLLHWLPIHFIIDFKMLTLVFKALAPQYLFHMFVSYEPAQPLRSSGTCLLVTTRASMKIG